MRRPLIAGNWKVNGTRESVAFLLEALKHGCERVEKAELAVFPPFVFLEQCECALTRTQISWGGQDVSDEPKGAYTGEISALMLRDFHCRYVIVGHSERRHLYGESNERVARKFRAALIAGIRPLLCVGETLAERNAERTVTVIKEQLAAVLRLHDNWPSLYDVVIAYEPVWAIGTGQQASPEQAQAVHAVIREELRQRETGLAEQVRIVYGGSVKSDNASSLLAMPDVDGVLVGGASLQAEQFIEIGEQCNHLF